MLEKAFQGIDQQERFQTSTDTNSDIEALRKERLAELEAEVQRITPGRRKLWRQRYGVPPMFQNKTFENFQSELQPKAFQAVKNNKGSLLLLSPGIYGVGKTHLVCALANYLVESTPVAVITDYGITKTQCPVYYTNETHLLTRIRGTYNGSDETEEGIYEFLLTPALLIIDDIGKTRPRDLSYMQSVYYRIIDDRYTAQRRLIVTTNLQMSELEEHLGGASADRLVEMCGKAGFIKMTGRSYRKQ